MTKDQELLLALRERDEARAEASRLDDEAIYQRGLYESARAEVERLRADLSYAERERDRWMGQVIAVAERQREACARALWDSGLRVEAAALRVMPLVTEGEP